MGLEEFKNDTHYHHNPKLNKKRLHKDDVCPTCGDSSKLLRKNEYRCNNSECEVIYYFTNNR